MEKKAYAYTVINVFVLLAAAVFFFSNYRPGDMFQGVEASFVGILIVTVMIVHCLKAIRLYFALYGGGLSFSRYLKIYCKATPVSIIFPFKTGELFRMYCYGMQTGDMLKGVITVVLDRFMDTIALLTMIIGINAICGGVIAPFVYGLIVFAVVLLLMYMAFPGMHHYWLKYLLRADATSRRIKVLKILDNLNHVYKEIGNVTRGRGIILYGLSLMAWGVEISAISLLYRLRGEKDVFGKIFEYISSAISSSQSTELKQFVFISVVVLSVLYALVKLAATTVYERI